MSRQVSTLAFDGRQRGISLIELMIGMLLSLILLGGVVLVFASSSEVNRNRQSMSLIADNARFALEHMNRQLRMAESVSFVKDGDELQAKLTTTPARTIVYTLQGDEIYFNDGSVTGLGDSLVDGINDWVLSFIVNNSPGTVDEEEEVYFSTNVLSVQIELTMDDPSRSGNPLQVSNNKASSTVALRNPLLAAYDDAENEGNPPIGVPIPPSDTPSLPDTYTNPDENVSNPEDPPAPQPPDTGQPLPEQQLIVECTSVTVTAVAHHKDAIYRGFVGSVSPNSFSGCARVGGANFACTGLAKNQPGFSVTLNFNGPGKNQKSSPTVSFACNP